MFEDKYRQANDALLPSAEAEEKTLSAIRTGSIKSAGRRGSKGLIAAVAAVLSVLFIVPSVIGITKLASSRNGSGSVNAVVEDGRRVLELSIPADAYSASADDYSAVFAKLKPTLTSYKEYSRGNSPVIDFLNGIFSGQSKSADGHPAIAENMAPSAAEPASAPSADGMPEAVEDHSSTNTQVEGVDEADIIKTDGRYIYVLNSEGVTVLSANGDASEKLSLIRSEDMPKHNKGSECTFIEMYSVDGKLIIIANEFVRNAPICSLPEEIDADKDDCYMCGYYYGMGSGAASVYVYDVTDPEAPKLENSVCQDGYYSTSRLTDGTLYLVTNYMPRCYIYEDMPCTYVPCTYDSEGRCRLTPAADIKIDGDENESASSFTYVSSLDLENTSEFSGSLAIMSNSGMVYCSRDNLYVTAPDYVCKTEEIMFDVDPDTGNAVVSENGSIKGTLYSDYTTTKLWRIDISGATPKLAAWGDVKGYLLNQFSMDEYNGFLRVVTDRNEYSYVEQRVNNYTGYCFDINETGDNVLYVLDPSLNVVGKVEDLGVDEHVKSVRFMGDTGYVVTFRQTDPLYCIDLSVPSSPRILSELKIPGFSEYLHPWGGSMLFGLGQQADIETGGTEGLKLSMFDISDRADVKELNCTHIKDIYYSAAEYNHKAILVSYERGIIGFPANEGGYLIYSYDESAGFVKRSEIKLDGHSADGYFFGHELRGMYIGDCFYIIDCSDSVMYVIDLNSFVMSGSVSFK